MSDIEAKGFSDELPILSDLRGLLEARYVEEERARRRLRWPSAVRVHSRLIVAIAALLCVGGATASAVLLRVGSPLPARPNPYAQVAPGAPPHVGPTPKQAAAMIRQMGTPLPRTARVYTLQRDPIGGPAWGVLVYRTSTGVICEHAGRVLGGWVGLLDASGQLHPWRADASGCTGYGGSERPVAAQGGELAWGGSCSPIDHSSAAQSRSGMFCTPELERDLYQGVLLPRGQRPTGARAIRLTITALPAGLSETTPDGAYAFVVAGSRQFSCARAPTATVTYNDGSQGPAVGLFPPHPPCQQTRPHPR